MRRALRAILVTATASLFASLLASPSVAADARSFVVWGSQVVHLAVPEGLCFLDPEKDHDRALLHAIDEDTFGGAFAAIAVCRSLAEGGFAGLTVLQADEGDRFLHPHEVLAGFTAFRAQLAADGAPTFDNRSAFLKESWQARGRDREGNTIAIYHRGPTLVDAASFRLADGDYGVALFGATPLRELVVYIDIRHRAVTADQLDALMEMLDDIIATLRRLNPT